MLIIPKALSLLFILAEMYENFSYKETLSLLYKVANADEVKT
jgi:hypothetical protein